MDIPMTDKTKREKTYQFRVSATELYALEVLKDKGVDLPSMFRKYLMTVYEEMK